MSETLVVTGDSVGVYQKRKKAHRFKVFHHRSLIDKLVPTHQTHNQQPLTRVKHIFFGYLSRATRATHVGMTNSPVQDVTGSEDKHASMIPSLRRSGEESKLVRVMCFTWRYSQPYLSKIAIISPSLIGSALFSSYFAWSLKTIVDSMVVGTTTMSLTPIIGGLMIGFPLMVGLTLVGERYKAEVSSEVSSDLRRNVFVHFQKLSLDFYKRNKLGDLLSRFANDGDNLEGSFIRMTEGAIAVGTVLLCLPMLVYLEWYLAVLVILTWPVIYFLSREVTAQAMESFYQFRQRQGRLLNRLQENLRGQPLIKGFVLNKRMSELFEAELGDFRFMRFKSFFFTGLVEQTAVLSLLFSQLLVTCVGAWLVVSNALSAGSLIAFVTLLGIVNQQLSVLVRQSIPFLINASGSIRRLDELLQEMSDLTDTPNAVELKPFCRAIRFEQVSFSYTGKQPILNSLDLTILAGQYVAFVGPSGAGKSTILNLVLRFYDVTDGRVIIDGQDVCHVTQESLRRQMGIVFQEAFLFDMSIRENIRLAKPDATQAEIEAAAQAAEIHDFILTLPQGYDTHVGDAGGRLSGGQRQRISIARALVRQPAILILDEPTASLDADTAAALNITLESLAKERTVIAVTHQLVSVVNADQIFVLDGGSIVEMGTHETLLAHRGLYYQLWQKQQTAQSTEIVMKPKMTENSLIRSHV